MAETPETILRFTCGCPDCGRRETALPGMLPDIGDDFDWMARDFNGFRRFMLEDLAARFPDRTRWTAADMEVVIVEVLAAVLDELSDMLDRVASEAFLETARRPESVLRLLDMIGYKLDAANSSDIPESVLESVRIEGPRSIHTQKRMVTVADYGTRLEEHPLVLLAFAMSEWTGSWESVRVAVIAENNAGLDTVINNDGVIKAVKDFHEKRRISVSQVEGMTVRSILRHYLEAYRMSGQEVVLQEPVYIGIIMSVSVRVARNYYRSEVRRVVEGALGRAPGGFFEPGRLQFGEDVYASDIIQKLMGLDGVDHVCLNRFKRVGDQYPDRTGAGFIPISGLEMALCDNNPQRPERGYYALKFHGGIRG